MSEPKPSYVVKRGQPSVADRYRDETTRINATVTVTQHAYLLSRAEELGIFAAEYLRRLIDADMKQYADERAGEEAAGKE